ncbi:MAG TPA: hypothetical protein VNH83_28305 [Bryobacteraceae bacterium]|nr:hypothetical protein [Bryobacteraceae bacterium]
MGPISTFLRNEISAVYRKPSSFKTDKQQHKTMAMEFHVKLGDIDMFPPAIRQAARCIKAVRPIRSIKLDLWEENFLFRVETGPAETKGDKYAFVGCEGKALRIFRSGDKDHTIWLSFQVKGATNKSNAEFTAVNYGEEVRISAEGEPELPGTHVADDKQKDLNFPDVEAQPKKRAAKKAAKVEKKKGARLGNALPRQLGTGPKRAKRKK